MSMLLEKATDEFGAAQLVTELKGFRKQRTVTLRVRGQRDRQWRDVGSLATNTERLNVVFNADPKAEPGDVNRVRSLLT